MRKYTDFFHQKRGDVRKQRDAIKKILADGPTTVSVIYESTQIPKELLVWNLVGMVRWGEVDVTGEDEYELIYGLKEV